MDKRTQALLLLPDELPYQWIIIPPDSQIRGLKLMDARREFMMGISPAEDGAVFLSVSNRTRLPTDEEIEFVRLTLLADYTEELDRAFHQNTMVVLLVKADT